ncbi:MAG: hypothetical protein ACK56I_16555 [bacterium]
MRPIRRTPEDIEQRLAFPLRFQHLVFAVRRQGVVPGLAVNDHR